MTKKSSGNLQNLLNACKLIRAASETGSLPACLFIFHFDRYDIETNADWPQHFRNDLYCVRNLL